MTFKVHYTDDRVIDYSGRHLDRVLYAVTSLEMTPLINDLGIAKITDENERTLWPPLPRK